uniref:Uncharacterized protein n=1 Tax=Astatotilapia calliptera TaxID=8154 RepID=A0A3P8QTF8_ASTCA
LLVVPVSGSLTSVTKGDGSISSFMRSWSHVKKKYRNLVCLDDNTTHPSIHPHPLCPGPGRGGSSLSKEAQTSLSPATSSSLSGGIPRRSQASREI